MVEENGCQITSDPLPAQVRGNEVEVKQSSPLKSESLSSVRFNNHQASVLEMFRELSCRVSIFPLSLNLAAQKQVLGTGQCLAANFCDGCLLL